MPYFQLCHNTEISSINKGYIDITVPTGEVPKFCQTTITTTTYILYITLIRHSSHSNLHTAIQCGNYLYTHHFDLSRQEGCHEITQTAVFYGNVMLVHNNRKHRHYEMGYYFEGNVCIMLWLHDRVYYMCIGSNVGSMDSVQELQAIVRNYGQ